MEHAGRVVNEAVNGAEAIPLAVEGRPDIIVMDVTMSIMDRLECTRRLRADATTSQIPILILTAHALASDVQDAKDAGANAYLSKPPPRTQLAEVERLFFWISCDARPLRIP